MSVDAASTNPSLGFGPSFVEPKLAPMRYLSVVPDPAPAINLAALEAAERIADLIGQMDAISPEFINALDESVQKVLATPMLPSSTRNQVTAANWACDIVEKALDRQWRAQVRELDDIRREWQALPNFIKERWPRPVQVLIHTSLAPFDIDSDRYEKVSCAIVRAEALQPTLPDRQIKISLAGVSDSEPLAPAETVAALRAELLVWAPQIDQLLPEFRRAAFNVELETANVYQVNAVHVMTQSIIAAVFKS